MPARLKAHIVDYKGGESRDGGPKAQVSDKPRAR